MVDGTLGLGYRIGATGADETLQKLKALHQEIREGTITTKDARKEHRELIFSVRSATGEYNDLKGAINAANPNMMEFTKTMSIFGGVAGTAMSALNTINLSLLQGSTSAQAMSAANVQAADDYNNFIRLFNSPQYGPGSPVTEAAYQKYQADLNATSNLQNQLGVASINTGISVGVSALAMAGSMSQTYTALKAIQWNRVFSAISAGATSALSSITWFAGAVVLPIAAFVAIFYGAYELIRALNPAYAQSMNELSETIQKNWNVSALEADLIAPFVGAYIGFSSLVDQWTEDFDNFVNSIINGLNTIPTAINNMNIPGVHLGTIANIQPPGFGNNSNDSFYNAAIADMGLNNTGTGIGPNTPYSQYTANNPIPNADLAGAPTQTQIMQQLQSLIPPTSKTAENSSQQLNALTGIGSDILKQNATLDSINSGINAATSGISTLAQPLIQNKQAQDTVKGALQLGFTSLQAQLSSQQSDLASSQAKYSALEAKYDPMINQNGSPYTASDFPDLMAGMQDVQNKQLAITATMNAISQNSSQQTVLDNMTSGLAPVLNSIGLSSDVGIGSIISGALGGAAGLGGAGINANQLASFAQTGDYGVFTQAANQDSNPYGVSGGHGNAPTQQDQINALLAAWQGEGINGYTAADAAKALGYGGGSGSSTGTYNPNGAFGGDAGQYGNPSTPSSVLGNFQGPTNGNSSGGVIVTVNNNIAGSLLSQQDLNETIQTGVKNSLLGVGWG